MARMLYHIKTTELAKGSAKGSGRFGYFARMGS